MQKFLCKIGCILQREQTIVLILAAWGLYLFALLGGKMQGNAVYTLRQCVTFGFFVLGAGLEYSLGDIDLCFMAQASLSTVWLGLLYQHGMPLPWALVCMVLSQIIMGALRGALAAALHIPMTVLSFILAVILSNLYPANDVILMNIWAIARTLQRCGVLWQACFCCVLSGCNVFGNAPTGANTALP